MTGYAIDHLAVVCRWLGEGVGALEEAFGVEMSPGGQHFAMGTHNKLLSLGPECYLEVISVAPDAPTPGRARWFGLDTMAGPPRLGAWIARTDDMDTAVEALPKGIGAPLALSRGDLSWQITVPSSGVLPFDGVFPAVIDWGDSPHPCTRLPDHGFRLIGLEVRVPDPARYGAALGPLGGLPVSVVRGMPGLRAIIETPDGPVIL
jgi:hypothetical protein